MKKISIILFLFITYNSLGQNQNSVWIFGDSAGIDFSNITNPIPVFSGMDQPGSCASISDKLGNLLFYCFSASGTASDTETYIFNSSNDTMVNGNNLMGINLNNQVTIVPFADDSSKYYVFHLGYYSVPGLYYSIVNMSLNGGQGQVIQKNIQLLNLEQGDCIEAIKHGNGRDWWVLSKLGGSGTTQHNRFYVYKISPGNSISSPIIQNLGNAVDAVQQRTVIKPDGNKIMAINIGGFMCEYDFDRCSGIILNPNIIFTQQLSNFTRLFVDGAYSPNGNVFYASRNSYGGSFGHKNYLLQYDLTASNIAASCDTVDSTVYPQADNWGVRLAPDGKIYYSQAFPWGVPYQDTTRNMVNENLGVVNNPDVVGAGCNFQPFSFYLGGKRTYYALPNNPDYGLGRWVGSPCDTLVYTQELEIKSDAGIFVFYHHGWQKCFINANRLKGKNCNLQVFDMKGKKAFELNDQTIAGGYFTYDLDCSTFAEGMYVVKLETEKEVMSKKFVK